MTEAVEFANKKAPEHLQPFLNNPESFLPRSRNYGSLFIGEYSPEVLGDYSSGLNHLLPTDYSSRYSTALSVRDLIKTQSSLRTNKEGLSKIASVARGLAEAEGLEGHMNSVEIRMKEAKK
jgi:histidinol dehydrogenase